ncbi:MAG: hypothetical protein Q7I98_00735 [Erysipelotrichaceae bacterium]|nr:hypothetical protein [Erysipelotrichaceae bacterium]
MLLEKAKSATLVVLFTICAYLSGLFLFDNNAVSAKASQMTAFTSVNIEDLLNPRSCHVSFGGGLYSGTFEPTLNTRLWEEASGFIRVALEVPSYQLIDQIEWDLGNTRRGVTINLPFAMTTDQILASTASSYSRNVLGQATFDTIVINTGASQVVMFGNNKQSAYYKFSLNGSMASLAITLTEIENDSNTIEYKRLEDIFSLRKILEEPGNLYQENHIVEPIVGLPGFEPVRVANELALQTLSENQERKYADIAFGERFDFVKRVTEVDGSIVYLYGYGDRALRFGVGGSFEYQERYSESAPSSYSPTFRDGLKKAVAELNKYGEMPENLNLLNYSETEEIEGQKVKRYNFGYKLNGRLVYLMPQDLGYAATVELTNNQLTHLKRNFKIVQKNAISEDDIQPVLGMDELIDKNYDLILKNYLKAKPESASKKDDFEFVYQILHDVTFFQPVYVLQKDTAGLFYKPAWRLSIGPHSYYFDLYHGDLLQSESTLGVK